MGEYSLLGDSAYIGQASPFVITPQQDNGALTEADQLQNSNISWAGGHWERQRKDEVQVEASLWSAEHPDWYCGYDDNGSLFSAQYVHWWKHFMCFHEVMLCD